jgi:hypothetical protein
LGLEATQNSLESACTGGNVLGNTRLELRGSDKPIQRSENPRHEQGLLAPGRAGFARLSMHHTLPRNAFSVGGPIESYEEFLAIALAVFGVNGCHDRVGKRG